MFISSGKKAPLQRHLRADSDILVISSAMRWFPEVPSNLKAFFFFFFFFFLFPPTTLAFHQEETLCEVLRCAQLAYLWFQVMFALQMRRTAGMVSLGVLPVLIGFAMPSMAGSAAWKRSERRDGCSGSIPVCKYDPTFKADLGSFHCVAYPGWCTGSQRQVLQSVWLL